MARRDIPGINLRNSEETQGIDSYRPQSEFTTPEAGNEASEVKKHDTDNGEVVSDSIIYNVFNTGFQRHAFRIDRSEHCNTRIVQCTSDPNIAIKIKCSKNYVTNVTVPEGDAIRSEE